jgi:large subunit ribosomal protein L17
MRHGKKFNHLGRKTAHRKAMLANMACSLIEHKRITTTVAKAKELSKFVEPLINRSKEDSTHSRRVAFRYLRSKYAVTELFREVAPKVAERPGGFTRIIRTGYRLGDSAEMCMVELVDFNEIYGGDEEKKTRSRRSRRGGGKANPVAAATDKVADVAEKAADTVQDTAENLAEVASEATEEVKDTAEAAEDQIASNDATEENDSDDAKKEDDKKDA